MMISPLRCVAHALLLLVALGGGSVVALSRYELSQYQTCETVDDCVKANQGLCDCNNGGGYVGINKNRVADFEALSLSGHDGCTEIGGMHPCDEGTLSCTDSLCAFHWKHSAVKTCQSTDWTPTPASDALTAVELEPFQQCFHDLQCKAVRNSGMCNGNPGVEVAINEANFTEFRAAFPPTLGSTCSFSSNDPSAAYAFNIGEARCVSSQCSYTPITELCDSVPLENSASGVGAGDEGVVTAADSVPLENSASDVGGVVAAAASSLLAFLAL